MNDIHVSLTFYRVEFFYFVLLKLLNYENIFFFPITLIPDRQQKLFTDTRSGAIQGIENQIHVFLIWNQ